MRIVYGAVFFGFAFVGFASVCNSHSDSAAGGTHTVSSPAQQENANDTTTGAASTPSASTVTVRTDLVEPGVIDGVGVQGDAALETISTGEHRRPVRRGRPHGSTRSLLARVVLGDGQHRPQPFPTPAGLR